ncbi:MAG TPA: ABC transporter substrate-binding protein [Chthoniobacteraceae bacterium]|nr:ABC transporter substrate-binding protein [Chthoniobacteraceae bacterium]
MRKKSFIPALFLPLLLFWLAGCDNNPNPAPLHTQRTDGSPWVVSYRNLGTDPRSLDPQYSYDTVGNAVLSQIYEGLFQYNLFATDPYRLEPCLAEAMPKRIDHGDGRVSYEIRLKKGIRFHDDPCFPGGKGREVTAHDFVYTFQRIADPKVECPVLSTLQEFVVGLQSAFEQARDKGEFDYSQPTGAITVIDDHTFRIHLTRPYPQVLYWLAMPFTAPIAREAVEYYDGKEGRDTFNFHPVGTGPFKMHEWRRKRLIRLIRHPEYRATRFPASGWTPDRDALFSPLADAPLPLVDEVQLAIIREAVPAWLLFRQGYLDRSGVSKDVFNTVITNTQGLSKKFEEQGIRLYRDVDPTTYYLQFNMEDPVVGKNKKLRQAISMAYDEDRANEIFRNGIDLKSEQLLPPGLIGYDPDFRNPYRVFDLEKAKQLLAEAGYPDAIDPATGQPLVLKLDVIAPDSASRRRAEFDKTQIEQLGIRCEIEENTWARFQDRQQRGLFQMNTGSGWHADYPDPSNFFFLFYSKNLPPAGPNSARFSNPEFDALFEKMSTMENGPERLAIIEKMNRILVEETPVVFMGHPVIFSLSQPWVPYISSNAMLAGGGGMKYQIIDQNLRAERRLELNRTPWWPVWTLAGLLVVFVGGCVKLARRRNL